MIIASALFWMLVVLSIPGVMLGAFGAWVLWQWIRIYWFGDRT
jgi:hypothetical protein